MRRRVLHVIPSLAQRYGGPSAAIVGMCRALAAAGTPALVAATDADGPGRLDVPTYTEVEYEGVPAVFFRREASESFKWSRPLAAWLDRHVREFALVHVHAVFSHSSIAAGRACRRHGIPYIVRPLGSLDPWSLRQHPLRKRFLMTLACRRLLAAAAAIHYTSEGERRLAEQALPWLPRGIVVPLGVDAALFAVSAPDRSAAEPYVLAMSRLDEKKGLDLLIAAFHDVLAGEIGSGALDDWRLIIAGQGNPAYVERLRGLANLGPARERIAFVGWVEGAERLERLGRATLFALPSRQENFGIAMVEAMACGVPVMVSPGVNLGAGLEAADAGWVVPLQRTAWRDRLRSAMTDIDECARRGRSARRFAEAFRWPAVAASLGEMYDGVIRSSTPRVEAAGARSF